LRRERISAGGALCRGHPDVFDPAEHGDDHTDYPRATQLRRAGVLVLPGADRV